MPSWTDSLLASNKHTKGKLDALFNGRQPLSEDAFYERFFAASTVPPFVVTGVREIFQRRIPYDMTLLAPDDDLSGEYRLIGDLDSMADVEIIVDLEKEFDITIFDQEAVAMKSFRDIVNFVWRKLYQQL